MSLLELRCPLVWSISFWDMFRAICQDSWIFIQEMGRESRGRTCSKGPCAGIKLKAAAQGLQPHNPLCHLHCCWTNSSVVINYIIYHFICSYNKKNPFHRPQLWDLNRRLQTLTSGRCPSQQRALPGWIVNLKESRNPPSHGLKSPQVFRLQERYPHLSQYTCKCSRNTIKFMNAQNNVQFPVQFSWLLKFLLGVFQMYFMDW